MRSPRGCSGCCRSTRARLSPARLSLGAEQFTAARQGLPVTSARSPSAARRDRGRRRSCRSSNVTVSLMQGRRCSPARTWNQYSERDQGSQPIPVRETPSPQRRPQPARHGLGLLPVRLKHKAVGMRGGICKGPYQTAAGFVISLRYGIRGRCDRRATSTRESLRSPSPGIPGRMATPPRTGRCVQRGHITPEYRQEDRVGIDLDWWRPADGRIGRCRAGSAGCGVPELGHRC